MRTPAALARAADAVVVADVTAFDDRDPAARAYRMHVRRSWKTRLSGPILIRTEATTCRAELTAGRSYLIYLKRAGRSYWTDGCAGNLPVARAARAMAVLGKPAAGR